ncbi:MAG TPA: TetR family transcriptional regulator [Acidimicrobiales bacterium]|nr:TetR family transcriptional regulator [Acidimicrobiales bacterium]
MEGQGQRGTGTASRTPRRSDPSRRDRIIDATLDVIAEVGVAGTSHRKIAARAGVPLGATTYYFADLDDILRAAFERFADRLATRYERRLQGAGNRDRAIEAIVGLIHLDLPASQQELVLTTELYTLASRKAEYRTITRDWTARSRRALAPYFDRETTHMLDALIEGLLLHAALDTEPSDRARTAEAVRRITAGSR